MSAIDSELPGDSQLAGRFRTYLPVVVDVETGDAIECGADLYDTYPGMIISGNPPETPINCTECGFTGYRIDIS